jgi:hypothetical protein
VQEKSPREHGEEAAITSPMLIGWKKISRYLSAGVRTTQRWETYYGLPVRRVQEGAKSTVLAYPSELESWAQARELYGSKADGAKAVRGESERNVFLRKANAVLQAENRDCRRDLMKERAKIKDRVPA